MSPLKLALATVSVAAVAGALGWVAFGSEWMRFRTLRVVGLDRVSEAQVRHLADLTPGEPLLALDLSNAVAGVSRHPWIAEVEARRIFQIGRAHV